MEKQIIHIRKYKKSSPKLFEKEKDKLMDFLNHLGNFEIEHIGSTAVPNLGGKNIIDLCLFIPEIKDAKKYKKELGHLGYNYDPKRSSGDGKRIFFFKEKPSEYHLHIIEKGGNLQNEALFFRNYLRTHSETAKEYFELKKKWAKEAGSNLRKYRELKGNFVRSVLKKAQS